MTVSHGDHVVVSVVVVVIVNSTRVLHQGGKKVAFTPRILLTESVTLAFQIRDALHDVITVCDELKVRRCV
jgi:hypothetical protein